MKLRLLLSLLLLTISFTAFCQATTITNSGTSYQPASITINHGESVNFDLSSAHNAVEVSESVWNNNGFTALSDGFQTPFGGGTIQTEQLSIGTHYYVCSPHAFLGMKGTIVVQASTNLPENLVKPDVTIHPNPSNGSFQIDFNDVPIFKDWRIEVFNLQGQKIFESNNFSSSREIVLKNVVDGIYFIKGGDGSQSFTRKLVVKLDNR